GSGGALEGLTRDGATRVAGRGAKRGEGLGAGQRLEVRFPAPPPAALVPEAIPLTILHEDDDLLVLDKPAGLVVHPGAGVETGTLVHALVAREGGLSGVGGPKRPGIVHRLARGPPGLMAAAPAGRAHPRPRTAAP